jgi:hypothetical protein
MRSSGLARRASQPARAHHSTHTRQHAGATTKAAAASTKQVRCVGKHPTFLRKSTQCVVPPPPNITPLRPERTVPPPQLTSTLPVAPPTALAGTRRGGPSTARSSSSLPAKTKSISYLKYPIYVGGNRGRGQVYPDGSKRNNTIFRRGRRGGTWGQAAAGLCHERKQGG